MTQEEIYVKLREHLHSLPGGFPTTKEGHEIKILKKLFTPDEAVYAMALRPKPEDVATIARRLSIGEPEASEQIENLARKGLIFRVREGNIKKYMAISYVVGIFEFQLDKMDREYAALHDTYKPYYGLQWISTRTRQMRTVPVHAAIQSNASVEIYDRARDFIKTQKIIGLADCICRKKNDLLGKSCGHPLETCLTFGDVATYYIDYKMARKITPDEALRVLELGERSGLVISPTNTVEHAGMCLCCSCGCGVLSGMKLMPNPADYIDSTYQAGIDALLCDSCGECAGRCQMGAIARGDASYAVNPRRCIGCGLCIATCDKNAVSFHCREGGVKPRGNFYDLLDTISKERGLAAQ
ncbi:MAG: 4Fe-4S binding protein [Spirochaetes bacterium]|nr:4Fe-4S binding protein [Spirochaetota bacterium]